MENKKKSKGIVVYILSLLGLFSLTIGVSMAFFNYTREGQDNTVAVGRIYFISRQTDTVSLSNMFPIDPTVTGIMDDETKVGTLVIEIEGDTDYHEGVEYLVSSVDSHIATSNGTTVPISLDIDVTGLGSENVNYFKARESMDTTMYKKIVGGSLLGDQMLLVGYIKPNTTLGTKEGVNGRITVKAYLDKRNIVISNTYDGTESDSMATKNEFVNNRTVITTQEWNALRNSGGVSFKIKVEANEGIWVKGSLEEIMKVQNLNTTTMQPIMDNEASEYVSASTGINFGEVSRDTNGKGIYMRAGTEDDAYPVLYYRGAVEDNNVVFANKCWKAVRTTNTGGVKLIYSGEQPIDSGEFVDADTYLKENDIDMFTFDNTDNTWNYEVNDGQKHEISFKVPAGDNYSLVLTGTTGATCGGTVVVYKDDSNVNSGGAGGGNAFNITHSYGTLTSSNVLKVYIYSTTGTSSTCSVNLKFNMQQGSIKLDKSSYTLLSYKRLNVCNNSGTDTQITVNGVNTFAFNNPINNKNVNDSTPVNDTPALNGYMYGTVYTMNRESQLTEGIYFGSGFIYNNGTYTLTNAQVGMDATHHYTCNSTNPESTCETIRYYTYVGMYSFDYLNLQNGEGIEDALKNMYTNTTNSNAKNIVDTWYASNMTSYTNKLEDTIWCNDRSAYDLGGWSTTGSSSLNGRLIYSGRARAYGLENNVYEPSLECVNKNDRFTVNNGEGNRKLTYPVALLTSDEMMLIGYVGGLDTYSTYLGNGYDHTSFLLMSPYMYNWGFTREADMMLFIEGYLDHDAYQDTRAFGIRPAISIRPGLPVISGTGTTNNPYVIE